MAKISGKVGLVRKPVRVLRNGKVFIRHQQKKIWEKVTPLVKRKKEEAPPDVEKPRKLQEEPKVEQTPIKQPETLVKQPKIKVNVPEIKRPREPTTIKNPHFVYRKEIDEAPGLKQLNTALSKKHNTKIFLKNEQIRKDQLDGGKVKELDWAKRIGKEIESMGEVFPSIMRNIDAIESTNFNTDKNLKKLAMKSNVDPIQIKASHGTIIEHHETGKKSILLNTLATDAHFSLLNKIDPKYLPPGCNRLEAVYTHQFGHVLESFIKDKIGTMYIRGVNATISELHENFMETNLSNSKKLCNMVNEIYKYSGDFAGRREAQAAGFSSMRQTPSNERSDFVTKQMSYINLLYGFGDNIRNNPDFDADIEFKREYFTKLKENSIAAGIPLLTFHAENGLKRIESELAIKKPKSR